VQTGNSILGNFIGTDAKGVGAIGNQFGGVLVDNLSVTTTIPQTIGGSTPGTGNLISGNNQFGIELIGPQIAIPTVNSFVQGNVIGLNVAGAVTSNGTGILIDNSPGNLIGGVTAKPGTGPGNIISGNLTAGVHVLDALSIGNQIVGNDIGTNFTGDAFPIGTSEQSPPQSVGVLIEGGASDTVGGPGGSGNVISGNIVGVQLSGLKQGNGQFGGGSNVVTGNMIGTDVTGTIPVSNLDAGVFINNSQANIIGPGNVISANGIAGVEILNVNATGNLITGNVIGLGADGRLFPAPTANPTLVSSNPQSGIPVFANSQLNGVVILGASRNTIGAKRILAGSQPNSINGNLQVGVYISSRDFAGQVFPTPVNNVVSRNRIQHDGLYGVLLFDAPNNPVRPFTSTSRQLIKNTLSGNRINFRDFLSNFDIRTKIKLLKHKAKGPVHQTAAHVSHPNATHKSPIKARPRVAALFEKSQPPRPTHANKANHHGR
jgi:hypothetical protein